MGQDRKREDDSLVGCIFFRTFAADKNKDRLFLLFWKGLFAKVSNGTETMA